MKAINIGVGSGLAIAQSVILAYGGAISVEHTHDNTGLCIQMVLPTMDKK